jgi:type II secretory pathway pseudopilin PulG
VEHPRSHNGASLVAVVATVVVLGILAAAAVIQLDLLGRQADQIASVTPAPAAESSTGGVAAVPDEAARQSCMAALQAVSQVVEQYRLVNGVPPTIDALKASIAGGSDMFGPTPDPKGKFVIDYSVGPAGDTTIVGHYLDGATIADC